MRQLHPDLVVSWSLACRVNKDIVTYVNALLEEGLVDSSVFLTEEATRAALYFAEPSLRG